MEDNQYFSILNGYHVKDKEAREDLLTTNSNVSALTSDVSDINTELDNMQDDITDLQNKTVVLKGTINSLVLDDPATSGSRNYIDFAIPTGWNINNTFIIGGYYKLYDSNGNEMLMRHINSTTSDGTTVKTECEVGYLGFDQPLIYCEFTNYFSGFVGYKVEFYVILMNNSIPQA